MDNATEEGGKLLTLVLANGNRGSRTLSVYSQSVQTNFNQEILLYHFPVLPLHRSDIWKGVFAVLPKCRSCGWFSFTIAMIFMNFFFLLLTMFLTDGSGTYVHQLIICTGNFSMISTRICPSHLKSSQRRTVITHHQNWQISFSTIRYVWHPQT